MKKNNRASLIEIRLALLTFFPFYISFISEARMERKMKQVY